MRLSFNVGLGRELYLRHMLVGLLFLLGRTLWCLGVFGEKM